MDDDDYGNESFESLDSPKATSPPKRPVVIAETTAKKQVKYGDDEEDDEYNNAVEKFKSPSKRKSTPIMKKSTQNDEEEEEDDAADATDGNQEAFDADMDLETFMSRHVQQKEDNANNANDGIDNNDPSLRPLDGLSPNPGDKGQAILSKRLGHIKDTPDNNIYNSSDTTDELVQNILNIKNQQEKKAAKKKVQMKVQENNDEDTDEEEETGDITELFKGNKMRNIHLVPPAASSGESMPPPDIAALRASLKANISPTKDLKNISDIEKENAAKVDSLLASLNLLPKDRKNNKPNFRKPGATPPLQEANANMLKHPKSNKKAAQVYGVGATPVIDDPIEVQRRSQLSQEQQISALKKELKMRDERLSRLTEHSMLLTSTCDDLKGQVSTLTSKLNGFEGQMEAKDQRIDAIAKSKKKLQKKLKFYMESVEEIDAMKKAYVRLQEREQALLEAVNELSNQNEDLISKLKGSMQRELELASMRSQVAKSMNNYADSVDEGIDGSRAQSDSMLQRNNGNQATKSKKNKGKVSEQRSYMHDNYMDEEEDDVGGGKRGVKFLPELRR